MRKLKLFYGESIYFFNVYFNSFKELKYAWQIAFYPFKTFNINGVNLYIDRKLISNNILKAIFKNNYEKGENSVINQILVSGDKLFEIGTGIGYNSITAAKIIGEDRVKSYEANPKLINLIQTNYDLNNVKIELINKVLTNDDHPQKIKFFVSENFWESSLIDNQNDSYVMVETCNFKEELLKFEPNTILCDIEGGEIELLSIELPLFVKKIILDTHPFFEQIGDFKNSSLIQNLMSQGFILKSTICHGYVYYFERN